MVHSFDIFDTCLVRNVATPADVFHIAAKFFLSRSRAGAIARAQIEDFVAIRISVERRLRAQSHREDITLSEIWRSLLSAYDLEYASHWKECELLAESTVLRPVISTRRAVLAARTAGMRIVFTSDMYLPSNFILRMLKEHGFAEEGDGLYISGEIGLTKASGNLFRHILEKEGIPASAVVHTGDHPISDYTVPKKFGITARHFEPCRLSSIERGLCKLPSGGLMAGAMRGFRISSDSTGDNSLTELCSQFVAPFILTFARWILGQAQRDGVARLYFMSRDCQLLWKVACELSQQYGGIECRYLYTSRQALFLPSADSVTAKGMPWMKRSFEDPSLSKLLAKVGITHAEFEKEFSGLTGREGDQFRLRTQDDWNLFWNILGENPIRTRIEESIATQRRDAISYFEREGLFQSPEWAIVDFGWYLTCQQALKKLLEYHPSKRSVRGYYMALRVERIRRLEAGPSEAIFYEQPPDFSGNCETSTIFSHQTLIEHLAGCADHPSVHHYGEDQRGLPGPVFSNATAASGIAFSQRLHKSVIQFSKMNPDFAVGTEETERCRDLLEFLSNRFFRSPPALAVQSLRDLDAGIDQNGLDSGSIVSPLKMSEALAPLFSFRLLFGQNRQGGHSLWPEGSLAITPRVVRKISSIVRRWT